MIDTYFLVEFFSNGWLISVAAVAAKATILLALSLVLTPLVNRTTPNAQYAYWRVVFVGILLIAMLANATPSLHIPMLPGTLIDRVSEGSVDQNIDPSNNYRRAPNELLSNDNYAQAIRNASWSEWLVLAWAVGVGIFLGFLALGVARTAACARRWRAVTKGRLYDLLCERAQEIGVRPPRLLLRHADSVPATYGLFRSSIILPANAELWDTGQVNVSLMHELVHIRRRDWLTHLLARITCALYWPIPLVWIAASHLGNSREAACDLAVVQHGVRPSLYAHHLLQIASRIVRPRNREALVNMLSPPSIVEDRIRSILKPNRRTGHITSSILPITMAVLGLILGVTGPSSQAASQQINKRNTALHEGLSAKVTITHDGPNVQVNYHEKGIRVEYSHEQSVLIKDLNAGSETQYLFGSVEYSDWIAKHRSITNIAIPDDGRSDSGQPLAKEFPDPQTRAAQYVRPDPSLDRGRTNRTGNVTTFHSGGVRIADQQSENATEYGRDTSAFSGWLFSNLPESMNAVEANTDLNGSNRNNILKKYELLFAYDPKQVLITGQQVTFILASGDVIEYERGSPEYELWMSEYNDYYHNRVEPPLQPDEHTGRLEEL